MKQDLKENIYEYLKEQKDEKILFDDWKVRNEYIVNSRKKDYKVSFSTLLILLLISTIIVITEWRTFIILLIELIVLLLFYLEWLNHKNSHIIVTTKAIYIINRYNKIKEYKVNINECSIELKEAIKKGILYKFYDRDKKLLCKYYDLYNTTSTYREPLTEWEIGLKSLNIDIKDNGIFKNKN